jgi:hypothetical protein
MACPRLARTAGLLLALAGLAACLPDDDREPPGRLVLTASADEGLESGIATVDGWKVAYDRFWLSLGHVRILNPDCSPYGESLYLRILDMKVPGPQTVATLHALGPCELGFQMGSSSEDVVLGEGVDEDVEAFMQASASDAFVDSGGVVLHVAGTATKSDVTHHFEWSFRQALDYLCEVILFRGEESQAADIRVRSAALFQHDADDSTAELRFDPYAAADSDGDSEITLDELASVPADGDSFETLAGRLYFGLVPGVVRHQPSG